MAKVFSWEIDKSKVYAYIVNPNNTAEAYVGEELFGSDLDKVISWTSSCSDEEYEGHFIQMSTLCIERGYQVKFESASAYMSVSGVCENLRGPAGRGIKMISYAGSGYENGRPVSFYNIIYDDDAFDTFTIRHGVDGKDGKDGEDGISGTPGVDAVSYKFFMIYTSGEIDENGEAIPPAKPGANEGFYDFNFDEFFPPAGWYVNDDNLTPPIWMSTRTFASVKSYSDPEWSNPVKLTGDNGKDGEDGNKTEFIYKLTKTLDEKPETPHSDPTEDDYEPEGWSDNPNGVTEEYLVEWMCSRKKTKKQSSPTASRRLYWGEWSEPVVWSMFGVNGKDGDGVEYIFLKNNGEEIPLNPTPIDWETNEAYQSKESEYIPPINVAYTNINGDRVVHIPNINDNTASVWLDSPSSVSDLFKYQWVSVRKYDGAEEKWQPFSDPKIWGTHGDAGQNGSRIIKIFKTHESLTEKPAVPQGDNAAIIGDWSMSFPKDFEMGKNVVYATEAEVNIDDYTFVERYRLIDDVVENAIELDYVPSKKYVENDIEYKYILCQGYYYEWYGGWCEPYIVTGIVGENGASSKLIVIYTNKNEGEIPETPEGGYYDFEKFEFFDCPKDWYTSDDEFYGITWMSTRTFSAINEYTDEAWSTPIRLTGERGVENKFFMIYTQSPEQPETPEDGAYDFSTRIFTCPEGWYINDDNFIDDPDNENYRGYTWMSTRTFSSIPSTTENNTDDKWSTPVRLTGENGKDGEDGETIEFIFKQSDKEPTASDKPENPTDEFKDDVVPDGWSDHPQGVNEKNQFEWMCSRKKIKLPPTIPPSAFKYKWGEWSNPVIWSKYGVNGKDGDGVEYIYIRTTTNETPKNPTPKDWKDRQGNYQKTNIEYLPPIGTEYTNKNGEICEWINDGDNNNIWTDSPLDITEKSPYIWVCTRKKKSAIVKKGGDSDLVEYIYQPITDINNPPEAPQSINIANNTPGNWVDDYNLEESPAWWFCKREKITDINGNEVWGEWSEPSVWEKYEAYDLIKLWQPFSDPKLWSRFANDGDDGRDGQSIEFIFKQSNREPTVSDKPAEPEPEDVFEDNYEPKGWSDHPNGVTEELPYEWMCTRTRSKEPNDKGEFAWGEWSNPVIWSKYGVNGKDGDGIQYIFFKNRGEMPVNPTPKNWENMESAYQEKYEEYLPPIDTEYTNISGETCEWSKDNYNFWHDSAPDVDEEYKYIWMCARKYRSVEVDTENSDGETKTMVSRWEAYSDPKLWTKYPEKGLDGPQGPAGIPGVSINFMFCLGTKEACFGTEEIINNTNNSNDIGDYLYWFDNDEIPSTQFYNIEVENKGAIEDKLENITQYNLKGRVIEVKVLETNDVEYYYFLKDYNQDDKFYVSVTDKIKTDKTNSVYLWCVQGRETPEKDDATKIIVKWGKPFLLQGANGLNGMDGKSAPIIYPEGIYNPDKEYKATAEKQPYVYSDGEFFLYNDLNETWIGNKLDYETPNLHIENNGTRWVKFEQFELFLSNVGVINNGLIGSAVFNNNFMFSQQGKDKDGNNSYDYQKFLNGYDINKDGSYSYKNGIKVTVVNPYEKNGDNFIHEFMPNVCINFSTGEFWAGYGRVHIADDVYVEKNLFGNLGEIGEIEVRDDGTVIYWHPEKEKESTGIFEGLFSKETMENFLGKPSLWDEKKDAFTGGKGLLGVVTPQLNKIKPEKFKWNETNNMFESANPNNTNNGSVSGLNKFLDEYLGKPGNSLNDGSGLFKLANNATTNTLGTLPEVDDKGGITTGNGLLGELGDTLVKHTNYKDKTLREYIGTPPSNNANGTMSRGSGILSATTKTIEAYIGTPPSNNANGTMSRGSGILSATTKTIEEYIGTPTIFDSDGDVTTVGRGLMLTAINQVKNYIGTPPEWNSTTGSIRVKGTGVLSGIKESLKSYVGVPPVLLKDGTIKQKGTGIFKGFEENFTEYLMPYKVLGSPGYTDSTGNKVAGTGLLAGLTTTTTTNNDNSLSIKNLNVEGFLLKQPTTLTEDIIKAIKSDYKNGQYFITKESLGSYIIIDSNVNLSVNIYLPGINGFNIDDSDSRMYIGETFQIYNYSGKIVGISGCASINGTLGSSPIEVSHFAIFKCVCKTDSNNKQIIVWEREIYGKI